MSTQPTIAQSAWARIHRIGQQKLDVRRRHGWQSAEARKFCAQANAEIDRLLALAFPGRRDVTE